MTTVSKASPKRVAKGGPRSASRLGAVQALYQIELAGDDPTDVSTEFLAHRLGQEVEGDLYSNPDKDFFRDLVIGTSTNRDAIDDDIAQKLVADWPLDRLEMVVRAILRAGVYELKHRPDVPTKAIINEYVDVAHAFYEGAEPGFVNGVLDRLSRELRAA